MTSVTNVINRLDRNASHNFFSLNGSGLSLKKGVMSVYCVFRGCSIARGDLGEVEVRVVQIKRLVWVAVGGCVVMLFDAAVLLSAHLHAGQKLMSACVIAPVSGQTFICHIC
jgi:hypothetical protein